MTPFLLNLFENLCLDLDCNFKNNLEDKFLFEAILEGRKAPDLSRIN